jgi:vacuolar protein sorting-associated protein 26
MDLLGLGSKVDVEFILDPQGQRKQIEVKLDDNNKRSLQYIYYDGEDVGGTLQIKLKKNSKVEHQGIRLEFIGQIEMLNDRSTVHEFINLSKLLAFPGELTESTSIDFHFPNVEKPYESYVGINVKLRYFLRLTIIRRFTNTVSERDICVQQLSHYPEVNNSIKMEVGIEDCLHIEFEYNKSKYHLKDVIVGKIYFLLVRIKIKHMEIAILKKESTGNGPNIYAENETIAKYEIMDGAPVRGESIPIRLFLAGYDMTPTMKDVQRKFSVRYYLNLVLIDEEERRYFKQQEITLWRKQDKDKDKTKQSPKQYAHFESTNKPEDNGTDGVNGPLSSENNSDTPSD